MNQSELKSLLHYDPSTGLFRWRYSTSTKMKPWSIAGSSDKHGYKKIKINGKMYKSHRLAWLITYRELTDGEIDHINGIKNDNRLCNLRLVSKSINQQNQRKARSDSTSGLLGVSWYSTGNKWKADIRVNGKKKHIGYFDCKNAAHQAYLTAKREMHEGNTL